MTVYIKIVKSKGSEAIKLFISSLLAQLLGEGNANLLQCSCLENPRDGGAWWAAVSGIAQSWT